jgi:O-antigen ligase
MPELLFLSGILIIALILVYLVHREYLLLGFVILTLIVIPSNLGQTLRTFVQVTDFIILFYLFFRQYGLDFRNYPVVPKPAIYFLVILYTSLFFSIAFSEYPYSGLTFVLRTTIFFIIIYFFYGIIRTQEHVKVVLLSIFISGFILVSSIILDFIMMGRGLAYLFLPMRDLQYGIYGNYNVTGSYAIIVFPLIIGSLYYKKLRNYRFLIWIPVIILVAGVLLLASRAALAGVVLGTAVILFFYNKKAFITITAVVTLILIIYFFFNPFGPSVDYALRLQNGLSGHDEFWNLALNIYSAHPIFGIGPGAYPRVEFNYLPVLLNSFEGEQIIKIHNWTSGAGSNNSHSVYLTMMSDMGIWGLITLLSLLTIFFKTVKTAYLKFREINKEITLIIVVILSVGICLTFRGFVESSGIFYYGSIATDLPFWLFFLILLSYNSGQIKFRENHTDNKSTVN